MNVQLSKLSERYAATDFPPEFAPLARRMRHELRFAKRLDPFGEKSQRTREGRRARKYRDRADYLALRAYDLAVEAGVPAERVNGALDRYRVTA